MLDSAVPSWYRVLLHLRNRKDGIPMRCSHLVGTLCVAAACTPLRYGRVESYRALPMPPEAFDTLDAYAAVVVPKPLQLHVSERGSAWLLLVGDAVGTVTEHTVVAYDAPTVACGANVGTLLAILPGDPMLFTGAKGLLVAHDGARCFGADGAPFPCGRSDAWQRALVLHPIAVPSREDSVEDAKIRAWYKRMLTRASVHDTNASIPAEELDDLAWEESVGKDLADAIPAPIGAGIAATILGGPVNGLIIAGVAYLVNVPYRLFADESGPEYGDTPMAASVAGALAEYLRQCTERADAVVLARPTPD